MLPVAKIYSAVISIACLLFHVGGAHAALVALSGKTVDFIYDTESVDPAYGTLSVPTGTDTIISISNGFRASSIGGVGGHSQANEDIFSAAGLVQIRAKSGYVLDSIDVREVGSYGLSAGNTSVSVVGDLTVTDWMMASKTETTALTIIGDLTLRDGVNHGWEGRGGLDLSTLMWNNATHVGLSLTNTLRATSTAAGESAFIEKTAVGGAVGISVYTNVIPVPATVWLLGSGLAVLAGTMRRRRNVA